MSERQEGSEKPTRGNDCLPCCRTAEGVTETARFVLGSMEGGVETYQSSGGGGQGSAKQQKESQSLSCHVGIGKGLGHCWADAGPVEQPGNDPRAYECFQECSGIANCSSLQRRMYVSDTLPHRQTSLRFF